MRWQHLLILGILTLALFACASPGQPVESTGAREGIAIKLWASTFFVKQGQPIKFRATVTNNTDRNSIARTHIVELKDRPVFDIFVTHEGQVIARWSDQQPLTSDLTRVELRPGESKTIEWDYVVNVECCSIGVSAVFIDLQGFPDDPVRTGVTVSVKYLPGHRD